VIGVYLESLQDGKLKPTPKRFATMQTEVQHLQRLVDDLRTLSLADSGELHLHCQPSAPQHYSNR
jgi:signal transduction histidine kinase